MTIAADNPLELYSFYISEHYWRPILSWNAPDIDHFLNWLKIGWLYLTQQLPLKHYVECFLQARSREADSSYWWCCCTTAVWVVRTIPYPAILNKINNKRGNDWQQDHVPAPRNSQLQTGSIQSICLEGKLRFCCKI